MGGQASGVDELIEHLAAADLPEAVKDLVLAAVLGDDELWACLGGSPPPARAAGERLGL